MNRSRVAVVMTYFGLFDEGMPAGFREDRLAAGEEVLDKLRLVADCGDVVLVDSADSAADACRTLADAELDAIIVVPTMATPPEWAVSVIRSRQPVAAIIVAVRELDEVPADYDTTQATRNSLLVGVAMLTNALRRESLPFDLVIGTRGESGLTARLAESTLAAHSAARLRSSRLLAFGDPIPGYSDVEATDEDLARLGLRRFGILQEDADRWSDEVSEADVTSTVAQARTLGQVGVAEDALARAAHVACVVRRALAETDATAGAINCHGPLVRGNPRLGVTGCLAVSLLAGEGVMLSCTGDIPAAMALVLGSAVAGSAIYCELYAIDQPGDWLLVANGGEGDSTHASPGSVRLLPEEHYQGVNGPGVAVAFEVPSGPATLVSITPLPDAKGGWRLVLCDAEVLGSDHPAMEGPNARVRLEGVPALLGFSAWCEAGASHHAALLPGRQAGTLTKAATFLGIESVTVSR